MADLDDRFKGVDPKVAEEIQLYEIQYFREDKPVPFCGLNIYPATVREYEVFSNCASCLTLNKNEDPVGIRMSQLDYLLTKTQLPGEEGVAWSFKIQKLFEIIFHIKNGLKCNNCGAVLGYDDEIFLNFITKLQELKQKEDLTDIKEEDIPNLCCPKCGQHEFTEMIKIIQDEKTKKHSLVIDGHQINGSDYNRLRQIVLFQNYPDYRDDSWVDPGLKKDYEERMKLERQKNDVYASVEQKVTCLVISTHFNYEEVYNMSIRRFTSALSTVDDLINYKIMKTAVSSGFISLPEGKTIDHWIYKPQKDMYGDVYRSTEQTMSKVNNL